MSEYILIGVDPGKTTGLFLYTNRPRFGFLDRQYRFDEVDVKQVPRHMNNIVAKATDYVGHARVHIAVERFIINARTAKSSQQCDALEVTGMVKAFAALHTSNPIRQYMKTNLKFANDVALRRAGWYSTKLGHATDAARQTYALLKDIDYLEWLAISKGAMMEFDDETKG